MVTPFRPLSTITAPLAAALVFLAPVRPAVAQATGQTLFKHVRVFDGSRTIGVRDVLVVGGKIAAIGTDLAIPARATVVDGAGRTLLPGLIDSHTHAYGDALNQALVFGVTTELDMFSDERTDAQLRAEQKADNVPGRADIYSAGTLVTAPKGHGTEYGLPIPTLASADSAQAFVDARIAEGSDYIKIIYDNGSTYGMVIPTLSKEELSAVVRAAHARGKLAVVHIGSLADARDAINAGADGLEHLFVDRAPDAGFGAFVAAHHAFVVPTLTVLKGVTGISGAGDLATDTHVAPYLSAASRGTLGAMFPVRSNAPARNYAAAEASVKQLRAAGVPILAGTDAPNPGTAHGIALHRELELLVHAGLSPTEALAAATSVPARLFSLNDRGSIALGRRADLLLVEGDPTSDITATRTIDGVWKGGTRLDRAAVASTVRTSAAAAKQAAGATQPAGGPISDFDSGRISSNFGLGWMVSTDQLAGGSSTATMAIVAGGVAGTTGALGVEGTVAPGLPFAWSGVMFMPGARPMQPTNISASKALRFWARGDGKTYHIMMFAESRGRMPIMKDFIAGAEWKEYTFPIASFDGIDGHDVMGIAFTSGPEAGTYRFRIDQVSLQ